jgi:NADP-reducing hydrogenase subunit HndB
MTKRIGSPAELIQLRDKVRDSIELRTGEKDVRITVHMGTCGIAAGARDVLAALAHELESASVKNVTLKQSGCAGLCEHEPMMTVADASGRQFRYGKLDKHKIHEIVRQHLVGGSPVVDFVVNA